jgi:restriction system protein
MQASARPTVWLVHNDQPQLGLVEHDFVSIGWPMFGDLRAVGDDRDAMKRAVELRIPDIKTGAIPTTAGMLLAFAFRMQVGDYVLYPHKPDGTVNLGRIAGPYEYHGEVEVHPHRRPVEWLATDVPRSVLSQSARHEIGGALTVFRVKRHVDEVLALGDLERLQQIHAAAEATAAAEAVEEPTASEADPFDAAQIEQATRDFIISRLHTQLEGVEFEYFVAHLLEAMGYRAEVTTASGDGGVDIIASRDPLGLEPPIIKVQCKRTVGSMGGPAVQQLTGTLGPGGTELGLFVTLGAFTRDALAIARVRHDLRLITGNDLVDLIFEHYERFDVKYKTLLPLRSVYVVERSGLS